MLKSRSFSTIKSNIALILVCGIVLFNCEESEPEEIVIYDSRNDSGTRAPKVAKTANISSFQSYLNAISAQSPEVLSQNMAIQGAAIDTKIATSAFFPTPYAEVNSDPLNGTNSASIGISQPIWTGGKLTANKNLAQVNERLSKANKDVIVDNISIEFVMAYGEWVAAYLAANIWSENLAESQNILNLIRSQEAEGFASQEELNLANKRILAQQNLLNSSTYKKSLSMLKMEQLLGRPVDEQTLIVSMNNYPKIQNLNPTSLLSKLLTQSNLARQSELKIRQAEASLKLAKTEFLPDLNIQVERHYNDFSDGISGGETRFGLGFKTNFGPGFSNRQEVEKSYVAAESVRYDQQTAENELRYDVLSTINSYQESSAQEPILANLVLSSQSQLDSFIRQFSESERSWEEILTAQEALADARASQAANQSQKIAAAWKLALYNRLSGGN